MGDWKRTGDAQDTPSVVLLNWLRQTMGTSYTADHLHEIDPDPANYPHYYTRHDQPDVDRRAKNRRWF